MKKNLFVLPLILIIGLLISACQKAPEKKVTAQKAAPGVENVALAKQLINYGYAHSDPFSLLAASKILIENPPVELKTEKDPKKAEGPEVLNQDGINVNKLLTDARRFAGENQAFDSLAVQVEKFGTKGAYGGQKYGEGVIAGGEIKEYIVNFVGLEPAVVVVVGDGNADLDLFVFDSNGNKVAEDVSVGEKAMVAFIPTATANFLLRVKNCGSVSSAFGLGTN